MELTGLCRSAVVAATLFLAGLLPSRCEISRWQMVKVDFQCFSFVFGCPAVQFLLSRRRKRGMWAAPDARASDASTDTSITPWGRKRRRQSDFLAKLGVTDLEGMLALKLTLMWGVLETLLPLSFKARDDDISLSWRRSRF